MRIKWVDNAKGIAMFCIIIGHIGGGVYGQIDLSFVHAFHLTTFFILSGYTLNVQKVTVEYINNRFRLLMVPYFYTCVAVMLIDIFNSIVISKDGRILTITNILAKDIIRTFFASGSVTNFAGIELGTRIGIICILPSMFFAVLIVQWVMNRFSDKWMRWLAVALIALVGYISSRYIWFPFSIQTGMTASVFILTGYYINKYSALERLNLVHYLIFATIFVLGIYKEYDHFYIVANICPDLIITFCVATSGSFLLLKLAQYTEKIHILNFVGKHFLIFLCVHLVALETMGWYFNYIISYIGVTGEVSSMWTSLGLNLLFAMSGVLIILFFQGLRKKILVAASHTDLPEQRDCSADIMKGILIISMLAGHSIIDINLRRIVYSCHMVAFVFLSGYFYHPAKKIISGFCRLCKSFLLPYVLCCLLHLLLNFKEINAENFLQYIKSYVFAISFSDKLFTDIPRIGVIWFVNMLFLVRVIYIFLDYFINSEWSKIFIILILSFLGFELGNYGYWLPWSLDCVLYCLAFYQIGILCKKFNVLSYVAQHPTSYFFLSIIWAYMIYVSSMELAIRQYSPYGLVIFGALCGTLLLYMLSKYISVNMLYGIKKLLKWFGENTLYIVIVHQLFSSYIYRWILCYLNDEYIYHMVIYIFVQLIIGTLIGMVISKFSGKLFWCKNMR